MTTAQVKPQWEIDRDAMHAREALFNQWFAEIMSRHPLWTIDTYIEIIAFAERCLKEFPRYDGESPAQIAEAWGRCEDALETARLSLSDYVRVARRWLIYNEAYHAQYEQDTHLDKAIPDADALVAADRARRRKSAEATLRGE